MKLQAMSTPSVTTIAVKLSVSEQALWELLTQQTGMKSSQLLSAIAQEVFSEEHESALMELLAQEEDDSESKTVVTTVESSFADRVNARVKELGGNGRSRGKVISYLVNKAFSELLSK